MLLSPLLAISLTACATGEQGADGDQRTMYEQVRYENDRLMDRDTTNENLQVRDEDGNPPNPTVPLAEDDRILLKDNEFEFEDADRNYHGQIEQERDRINRTSYQSNRDQSSAERVKDVTEAINNVKKVHSVQYGKKVIIKFFVEDERKINETKRKIVQEVKPYVKNRPVQLQVVK